MIDTHAHLDFPDFQKDRGEVISRFFGSGPIHIASRNEAGRGKAIINIGVDIERSRKSIEIAEQHEKIYASVGIHPEYFMEHGTWNMEQNLNKLRKLAKHEKVVAIGETGLDYYHITHNPAPKQSLVRGKHETENIIDKIKKQQKEGFLAQIELARELGLPVIVHCRNASSADSADKTDKSGQNSAWEDLYEIVKSQYPNPNIQINPKSKIQKNKKIPNTKYQMPNTKFVLHCYSGEKEDTEKFLELPGVFFSFSGNITYPKPKERADKLAEAVRMVPLDKIMLDSDAPFLAPQEKRGKRNEPINVLYIAKKIAEIKNIEENELERVTDENAKGFFGLNTN